MQVYDFAEFTQNIPRAFDTAMRDDVMINTDNGSWYKLLYVKSNSHEGKSPLEDIPCIKADITTQEIVELLRESRAGI